MIRTLALAALVMLATGGLSAQADDHASTTYRRYDAKGEYQGTVRASEPGRLRFYDEKGQFTGKARQDEDGDWRLYDPRGKYIGRLTEEDP